MLPKASKTQGTPVSAMLLSLFALSLSLTALIPNISQAQNILREELQKTEKKWGVSASLNTTTSLHKSTDPNRSAESRLGVSPNYKINDKLKATATFSGSQQLNSGKKSRLSNTRVQLQHSAIKVSPDFSWFPTVLTDLPTDVEGRKRNSFRTNLGARATGILSARAFEQNFSIIPVISYTRNFHRLTRTADDVANIQQSALASLYLETGLAKDLTLTLGGYYNHGWTYQTSTRESFSFSQELAYQVDKTLSVSLGHSNDAGIFAADGRRNNVRFFDDNTSAVYVGLRGVY